MHANHIRPEATYLQLIYRNKEKKKERKRERQLVSQSVVLRNENPYNTPIRPIQQKSHSEKRRKGYPAQAISITSIPRSSQTSGQFIGPYHLYFVSAGGTAAPWSSSL